MKKQAIVYHLNIIANKAVVDHLNQVGWEGHKLYSMHADITVSGDVEKARQAWEEGVYKVVALVDTTDLDRAYAATNHITHSWTENDDVRAFVRKQRSTSVGDIIEIGGELHLVADCGFTSLGNQ